MRNAAAEYMKNARREMRRPSIRRKNVMRNNRIFALCYRLIAFILCLIGILYTTGAFSGEIQWTMFLYYTTESNILVLIMFGLLAVKTARDLKRNGAHGPASYCERLSAVIMLAITVTMLIFWGLLAPYIHGEMELWAYSNQQLHTFTPLFMIFDHFFFAKPGRMKRQDPWLFALIPFAYFMQATILGFSGVWYSVPGIEPARFPYFFINFDLLGARVFLYVAAITIFFVGFAYLMLWYDGKRASKRQLTDQEETEQPHAFVYRH
jgi:hypothetical protein